MSRSTTNHRYISPESRYNEGQAGDYVQKGYIIKQGAAGESGAPRAPRATRAHTRN